MKPLLFGYSAIGILNMLVVQWFFIRIQYAEDRETGELLRIGIRGFIWPLTGWWNSYRFCGMSFTKYLYHF